MQLLTVTHLSGLVVAALLGLCAAATSKGLDCSQFQQSASVAAIQVRVTSLLDNEVGPNGYLHAQIAYAGNGWLGFGYSANGKMVPGYAVIGLPAQANSATNPGKYSMNGEFPGIGGVALMDSASQTLKNATVEYNSTHTVLTFSKRLIESGELTIDGAGSNNFLVAFGGSVLGFHSIYQSFPFTLQSCVNGSSASLGGSVVIGGTSDEKQLWTAHGVFAAVAWGVLAPVAISASILRRIFIASDLPALWFKIHMTVNVTVLIFTSMSFAFAVRATSLQNKEHFSGVKHRKTGLVIMILVLLQVLFGLLRPHLPHPKEPEEDALERDGEAAEENTKEQQPASKKSCIRLLWEILHRLLGFVLVGFAWWQVGNGLGLYSQYFSERDLSNVFWGITGGLSGITLVFYFFLLMDCV